MTDRPTSPTAPATKRARADGWRQWDTEWHWSPNVSSDEPFACGAPAYTLRLNKDGSRIASHPQDEPPTDADVCGLCRINYDAEHGIYPDDDAWMREGDRVIPI